MAAARTTKLPRQASETTRGLRILLVDDDADSTESMASSLGMNGHDVRVASDGKGALDETHAYLPDVVLLDIGLPGSMDGYEVAKRLQEQNVQKRPLLIALTGFGCEADQRRSEEVGIDLFLVKPADMNGLLPLLKRFQCILDR